MLKSSSKNKIKNISYSVNAQHYRYTGERVSLPYSRNDFYKIWLIENKGRFFFNEREVLVDKPALVFTNPSVSYAYESLAKTRTGYWCVFKKEFLHTFDIRQNRRILPLLNAAGAEIFFPDKEQTAVIKSLFKLLIMQLNTAFAFKDEVMRNYIYLLVYEGLKMKNAANPRRYSNAASRIAASFLELLEKQFPVQSPEQPLELRKAGDFASRLSVHVNHLNYAVKDVTGKSTTTLISERMMNEAKALLKHSDWNIADIAYSLGFEHPNHFNNYFKKYSGITPVAFRKK